MCVQISSIHIHFHRCYSVHVSLNVRHFKLWSLGVWVPHLLLSKDCTIILTLDWLLPCTLPSVPDHHGDDKKKAKYHHISICHSTMFRCYTIAFLASYEYIFHNLNFSLSFTMRRKSEEKHEWCDDKYSTITCYPRTMTKKNISPKRKMQQNMRRCIHHR